MEKQAPLGIKMEIKVHPRQGSNHLVYPLNIDPTGPVASPPNRDEPRPFRRWIPWLIPGFVVINVIVFGITMYVNNCPKNHGSCFAPFLGRFAFQPRRQNAMLGPSPATLEKMGALDVNKVIHGHQGWRLITCIWLHAGVIHILANMLSLLFIGIRLEQDFGFAKIGLLYVISGFGGSLMSALFLTSSIISVGASGALFGLLGSMLSELLINWSIYVHKFAALFILVFIIVINLAVGLFPHVDNFAHIGGFISGFLLGFIFLIRPQFGWIRQQNMPGFHSSPVKPKHTLYQYMYWILAVILLIVWFTGGVILLYRGDNVNEHCSWCHYLSCLPTSKWRCRTSASYCSATQIGNMLNLTCKGTSSGSRARTYSLPHATDDEMKMLCSSFCS